MLIDSRHEIFVFVAAFICGLVICVIFDVFRAIRKNISHSVHIVNIHDILFCAIAFFLVYHTLSVTNEAIVRWYEIASLFIACSMYFLFVSKYVLKFFTEVFCFIIRPVQIISGRIYIVMNTLRTRFFKPMHNRVSGFSRKCIKKLRKQGKNNG